MHAPTIMTSSPTPLAEWELQIQIQQALSDKLTGQIQITFLNGTTASLFVQHGIVCNLYIRNHRAPNLNWGTVVARFGRGILEIEPVPARALMFKKVIIEEITSPQPTPSGTSQLATMFSLAEYNPDPTLFHIRWEKAEAFVLAAGGRISIRHAILLNPSGAEEGTIAFEHISAWEESRCDAMIYRGNTKNQAWLELHLNILFEWYCQNMLNYYQQLTGTVMVKSILQSLAVFAGNKGRKIYTQQQQLRDVTLFRSAAEAANAYREILSMIRSRIEPVIGSSLTQYLMKQSTEGTTGVYKTIQESFGLVEDAS